MAKVDIQELKGVALRDNATLHWFNAIRLERESKILERMIGQVRSGKATFESLYGGISAIAELRSTVIDMEQNLKASTYIEQHEVSHG